MLLIATLVAAVLLKSVADLILAYIEQAGQIGRVTRAGYPEPIGGP